MQIYAQLYVAPPYKISFEVAQSYGMQIIHFLAILLGWHQNISAEKCFKDYRVGNVTIHESKGSNWFHCNILSFTLFLFIDRISVSLNHKPTCTHWVYYIILWFKDPSVMTSLRKKSFSFSLWFFFIIFQILHNS